MIGVVGFGIVSDEAILPLTQFRLQRLLAEDIAETLGDATKWHSHGRGISMRKLQGNSLKLKIDDFGKNEEPSNAIRNYHGLAVDYCRKTSVAMYIHPQHGHRILK